MKEVTLPLINGKYKAEFPNKAVAYCLASPQLLTATRPRVCLCFWGWLPWAWLLLGGSCCVIGWFVPVNRWATCRLVQPQLTLGRMPG